MKGCERTPTIIEDYRSIWNLRSRRRSHLDVERDRRIGAAISRSAGYGRGRGYRSGVNHLVQRRRCALHVVGIELIRSRKRVAADRESRGGESGYAIRD